MTPTKWVRPLRSPLMIAERTWPSRKRIKMINRAAAAWLADRGRLEPGLRADVIRVHPLGPAAARLRGTWVKGLRVA